MMESKINGSFKDIATLITAYNNLKENYGIEDWSEEEFEESEKKHHVRRGFELMYRNLMDGGRASTSTIEYMLWVRSITKRQTKQLNVFLVKQISLIKTL